jgi:hypothetical protein
MLPPVIVNISRLHRETAAVIQQADRSDCPVFVTQYAYVAAVLLPRRMYDRLLRAADKGTSDKGAAGAETADGQDSWTTVASPLEGPLAVFGPLPPHTQFLSKYGFPVDAQLAAFLMEEGEQVRPILEQQREEDQAE